MSAARETCPLCARALFVKLSRDERGAASRTTYCGSCDARAAVDPTTTAGRRAAGLDRRLPLLLGVAEWAA